MRTILLLITSFLIFSSANAQDVLWDKSYGGLHAETLTDVLPTNDYGFLLAGSSISDKSGNKQDKSFGGFDYWLWKMNESGGLVWQKSFGGSGTDLLQKILTTADGGFLLAGSSNSNDDGSKKDISKGLSDFWIIKLNADGSEQWQASFGGYAADNIKTAIELSGGGFLIAGESSSTISGNKAVENYGNKDIWLVRINSSGEMEWENSYGGTYVDEVIDVTSTEENGIFVLGYSNSPESGNKKTIAMGLGDYWLINIDENGNEQWQNSYGGDGDDHPSSIASLADGNLLIGGVSTTSNSATKKTANEKGTDIWLFKINVNGNILWEKVYNIGEYDMLASITENDDNTILLGGYAKSEKVGLRASDSKGINDFMAIKIKADGEKIWQKEIGSNGDDILTALIKSRDGGYILAGTSKGAISRERNSSQGGADFWVVKLLDENNEEDEASLLEAIPNPTERFTNVILNMEYEKAEAFMYDITGRLIQEYEVTGRTLPVDLRNLPMGVYLIQVIADDQAYSVKILKK